MTVLPARVLIVESEPVLSREIRAALDRDEGFAVLDSVASAEEATRCARLQRPDLVLCESTLPEPGAGELARFFRLRMPGTVVVFVAPLTSEEELFEAARAGASAYLRGTLDHRLFLAALRRTVRGEFPIDDDVMRHPAVAARVMAEFRAPLQAPPPSELAAGHARLAPPPGPSPRRQAEAALAPLFVPLSAREIEILDLVARGNSNKLIARKLGISDQTVKNHVSAILRKLEVNDRTEAVVYALRNGWIRIDSAARAGV